MPFFDEQGYGFISGIQGALYNAKAFCDKTARPGFIDAAQLYFRGFAVKRKTGIRQVFFCYRYGLYDDILPVKSILCGDGSIMAVDPVRKHNYISSRLKDKHVP